VLDPTIASRFTLYDVKSYRITELARRFGLSRSTLLYYDRKHSGSYGYSFFVLRRP